MFKTKKSFRKWACPRCESEDALEIGQLNYRGKLRWYESVNCGNCDLRSETDGVGFPPDEVRERLIALDGLWCVRLDEIKSIAGVVKILRYVFLFEMKEAVLKTKNRPATLYCGTRGEGDLLFELLKELGESPVLEHVLNT